MVSITADVELHIRSNTSWAKLPSTVKASLGNAPGLYEKAINDYSVKNQLRWRSNMVRHVMKDERKYYEVVLQYSQEHLMLYPYHLQDMLIKGLRVTPFLYYSNMMAGIMQSEKSYDSLPNFTAADCLRLMGIGRNQYIDLMNQFRSKKFFRKRGIRDLLPNRPVTMTRVEPWWVLDVGFVTEDDIKLCSPAEHKAIDKIIDSGKIEAGLISKDVVLKLYNRGLIYLDIPISNSDFIVVPPLQGFVMNRVQGDYFETLLYKIFVSIDEHTNMSDLANVLQVDLNQVKDAVSVFIRLAFAYKKNVVFSSRYHASWSGHSSSPPSGGSSSPGPSPLTIGTSEFELQNLPQTSPVREQGSVLSVASSNSGVYQKRLGFLFDSTLTAFLMMGNLSPGLKNHAVTMFEVGKLADESMDSFIVELGKVVEQAEGEAKRYYEHAITLRTTLVFMRNNPSLFGEEEESGGCGLGVDLLRLESMSSLDPATLARVMQKNYNVLISMAPLSQEVKLLSSCMPPHLGPPVAEMNSIWFKLWLYSKLGCGPPSLLLARGNRLRKLPDFLKVYTRVLVTTWAHDPASVYVSNLLLTVNDALTHSAVLIQGHGKQEDGEECSITFPLDRTENMPGDLLQHPCLHRLEEQVDLAHTCGYVTLLKTGVPLEAHSRTKHKRRRLQSPNGKLASKSNNEKQKITEFLQDMQELGIGDPTPTPQSPPPADPSTSAAATAAATSSAAETSMAGRQGEGCGLSAVERRLVSEWVPLGLNFGIPLFDEEANRIVCEKIVSHKLLCPANLTIQTQANRLLALDVLEFISKHQDIPYFPEGVDGTHFSDTAFSCIPVPMPTRNLLFMNGTLTDFDS